jgi:hypothetical protein
MYFYPGYVRAYKYMNSTTVLFTLDCIALTSTPSNKPKVSM